MNPQAGPVIVIIGIVIAAVGALIWAGGFGWFGRLPGDIRIERESVHIYIPLASMLLVSVLFSLIMYAVRRLK